MPSGIWLSQAITASLDYWCHLGASTLVSSLIGQMYFCDAWVGCDWVDVLNCDWIDVGIWMAGWTGGWMHGWINGWLPGWMVYWMDGLMDGPMDGW